MHRSITIFFISLLFICNSNAQVIRGAVIAGGSLTQVDGDEVYGWKKIGLNIGAAAIIPFGDKWSVSLENIYNQKGSYQKPTLSGPETGEYKLILDYVEIPLMVHFTDKDYITAGIGLSWGRLINIKEYEHGNRIETTTLDGPYKREDWNILIDIRIPIYQRLKFNFRYAYSMVKIRSRYFIKTDETRDQFNTLLTFRLIYIFNEKISSVSRNKSIE